MIRFLADANLHDAIVAGLEGLPDPEVLAVATHQNRILVTSDLRTMPHHFGDYLEAHGECAGVFLIKQRVPLIDAIDTLVRVWAASDSEEWKNRIVEISQLESASCFGTSPTPAAPNAAGLHPYSPHFLSRASFHASRPQRA